MKKEYRNPEMQIIKLVQFDVITTSGGDDSFLDGGAVNKDESHWSGTF